MTYFYAKLNEKDIWLNYVLADLVFPLIATIQKLEERIKALEGK